MPDEEIQVWEPSDEWVAGLVRRLRGLPPGEPVPAGVVASWRRLLRVELIRRGRARAKGREPGTVRVRAGEGPVTADDVIKDLLTSPEAAFFLAVMETMPAMIAGLVGAASEAAAAMRAAGRMERSARQAEANGTWGYLDAKLRGRRVVCAPGDPPTAFYRAGVNAATVLRARGWQRRLEEGGDPADVLVEIREVGRLASLAAAPLRISDPEDGPPRGLWPDPPPPPPEETSGKGGALVSGSRPAFVSGDGT